ncbi:MAG: cob(I)yrinic acid a,c-diamide adenosyltransferase [Candidatus Omnitrophica bacterium]|nr:cob(I)yrinic acid a,c-diamide adenosyltransferase [Candidatus Omnitrophota bacterium]
MRAPRTRKVDKSKIVKDPKRKGLLMVHTGDGKGKTTAALGLALRAVGCGMKVMMIQFMKGTWKYGELEAAKRLAPDFTILQMGEGFTWETKDRRKDIALSKKTWEFCKETLQSGKYGLVILDEMNYVLGYGFLDTKEVVDFLKKKPEELHVVLTGRNAPKELVELADLVTEMKEVKHPFQKGIIAQRGIEF